MFIEFISVSRTTLFKVISFYGVRFFCFKKKGRVQAMAYDNGKLKNEDVVINLVLPSDDVDIRELCAKLNTEIEKFRDANPAIDVTTSQGISIMLKMLKTVVRSNGRLKTYDDIAYIDELWNVYTYICACCGFMPTLLRFSMFTGISNETMTDWEQGNIRARTSDLHLRTVKKWKKDCESGLFDKVVNDNGIGAMFALKANYGYRDNVVVNVNQDSRLLEPAKTPEQIAADIPIDD